MSHYNSLVVDVDVSDLGTAQEHGSIITITGTLWENPPLRIRFAGDYRSMQGLLAMVQDEGEVAAVIEDWQVLSTSSVDQS